jgi:hypothetical protein
MEGIEIAAKLMELSAVTAPRAGGEFRRPRSSREAFRGLRMK